MRPRKALARSKMVDVTHDVRPMGAREQGASVEHYREWRYEDLVTDAEPVLREICEYAELLPRLWA